MDDSMIWKYFYTQSVYRCLWLISTIARNFQAQQLARFLVLPWQVLLEYSSAASLDLLQEKV